MTDNMDRQRLLERVRNNVRYINWCTENQFSTGFPPKHEEKSKFGRKVPRMGE